MLSNLFLSELREADLFFVKRCSSSEEHACLDYIVVSATYAYVFKAEEKFDIILNIAPCLKWNSLFCKRWGTCAIVRPPVFFHFGFRC